MTVVDSLVTHQDVDVYNNAGESENPKHSWKLQNGGHVDLFTWWRGRQGNELSIIIVRHRTGFTVAAAATQLP
jgi:hypothetical protein